MFRVTIRAIQVNEDDPVPVSLSLGAPASCLIVPGAASSEQRIVAAHGWAKTVGLGRRSFLLYELGSRQEIVDACTSVGGILEMHELTAAPRYLCPDTVDETTHWVLDNSVEAWLISVTPLKTNVRLA